MAQTKLSSGDVFIFGFDHFVEMKSNPSDELNDCFIEGASETRSCLDFLAELWIRDAKHKFLLLGALGSREVGEQEIFQSIGNFVLGNRYLVFKSLFG